MNDSSDELDREHADETNIVATPDVCWGMVGENLLLFGHHDRHLHVLNSTAAMVWAMTDRPTTMSALVKALSEEYDVEPAEIEDDITMVVERLRESDLCLLDGQDPPTFAKPRPVQPAPDFEPGERTIGPYDALGTRVFIDVGDARLSAELRRVLAPLADERGLLRPDAPTVVYHVRRIREGFNLFVNERVLTRGTARSKCFRAIMSDINSTAIGYIDDAVVLHASAADVDGSIVAFPGVSNSGKSTLVAKLVMRGHGYVTDEALVVGTNLGVRPFHKSICIDKGSQRELSELEPPGENKARDATWDVDPRNIGAGELSAGGQLNALIFPIFRPDMASAELRRIEAVEVMHRLLANSFDFSAVGQRAFAILVQMANKLPAFELAHGGAGQLDLIESVLAEATLSP